MARDPRRRERSRKPRGDSRTIPIRGYGDDDGKYFTCWYCGFTCNKDRDKLGGLGSKDGLNHEAVSRTAPGAEPGEHLSALAVLDGDLNHFETTLKADSSGNGIPPVVVFTTTGTGCPLCHSHNWRGDF